jgi:hypothetical protein
MTGGEGPSIKKQRTKNQERNLNKKIKNQISRTKKTKKGTKSQQKNKRCWRLRFLISNFLFFWILFFDFFSENDCGGLKQQSIRPHLQSRSSVLEHTAHDGPQRNEEEELCVHVSLGTSEPIK